MDSNSLDFRTVSAMQNGSPYAKYKKTILGQVHVMALNSFTGQPEGVILTGLDGTDTSIIEVWSDREDTYFKRANKKHFEVGNIIPIAIAEVVNEELPIEQYSDEQIRQVTNKRFAELEKLVTSLTSEAVVIRLIKTAESEGKSVKVVNMLQAKLSQLQGTRVE